MLFKNVLIWKDQREFLCVKSYRNSIVNENALNSAGSFMHGGGGGGRGGGDAMVLGKLSVPGRPTIWILVGQGPTALAVGAGGGCLDIFTFINPSRLFLPLFGRRPDID